MITNLQSYVIVSDFAGTTLTEALTGGLSHEEFAGVDRNELTEMMFALLQSWVNERCAWSTRAEAESIPRQPWETVVSVTAEQAAELVAQWRDDLLADDGGVIISEDNWHYLLRYDEMRRQALTVIAIGDSPVFVRDNGLHVLNIGDLYLIGDGPQCIGTIARSFDEAIDRYRRVKAG